MARVVRATHDLGAEGRAPRRASCGASVILGRPDKPGAWGRNPMYAALKAFATEHWGKGKLAMAVAGRRTWVTTPQQDIALGEVEPGSGFKVVEGADGTVTVEVAARA